jgi:hypothetical protein
MMCIYGVELQEDNVEECRSNLLSVFDEFFGPNLTEDIHKAAEYILSQNIICGDALSMRTAKTKVNEIEEGITFPEWGYLGKGKFQRRDFRFDALTQMSAFSEQDTLFAEMGRHEVFKPVKVYPQATIPEIGLVKSE